MKKVNISEIQGKGLLFLVNTLLHSFGYCLVSDNENDTLYFAQLHQKLL